MLARLANPATVVYTETMTEWIVRIENEFVVEADTEEDAKRQALHDMAFGLASVAETVVTDVRMVV